MNKNVLFYIGLFHFSLGEFCFYEEKNQELNCNNFTNFDDLNLQDYNNSKKIKKLSFNPSEKIDFDYHAAFQLDQITNLIDINSEITLKNFLSFDVSINDFFFWNSKSVYIDESKINFLINNQSFDCDIKRSSVAKFFRNFGKIKFGPNVEFIDNKLCSIIFYRITLTKLEFTGLESVFEFLPKNDESFSLNSSIKHLVIEDSNFKDLSILDKAIFGSLESITYSSKSTNDFLIEDNFFQKFDKIFSFNLSLPNILDFIYKTKLKWLLNTKSTEIELVLRDDSGSYSYPEEDFCIFFNSLSKKKINFINIETNETAECSCTLAWLFYITKVDNFKTNIIKCEKIKEISKSCLLNEKISQCLPPTTTSTQANLITAQINKEKKENLWSIITGIVGLTSFILLLPLIIYYINYQRKKNFRKNHPHEVTDVNVF